MSKKLRYFIANSYREVGEFFDSLTAPVHILGNPAQFIEKGKTKWIVWFTPTDRISSNIIDREMKNDSQGD